MLIFLNMVGFRFHKKVPPVEIHDWIGYSGDVAKRNYIYDRDNKPFSLVDKRVDGILERVRSYISDNKFDVTKNQKEIASEVVRLIHSDEFYGKYNPRIEQETAKIKALQCKIEKLEEKKELTKAESKELESLSKEKTERQDKHEEYYASRGSCLADMKKGSLVCREQAAITSLVLHKVGIPNDLCLDMKAMGRTNHAFVQLLKGADIIECTNPKNPYRENISGGFVRGGNVVITREPNTLGTHSYGKGSTDKDDQKVLKEKGNSEKVNRELYRKDYDRAMLNYELVTIWKDRRHGNLDMSKTISVSDALINAEADIFNHDKPKKFLNLVMERRDGKLSLEETIRKKEHDEGRKLTAKELGDLKKDHKEDPKVYKEYDFYYVRQIIKGVDANSDGKITPAEFAKAVNDISSEYARIYKRPIEAIKLEEKKAELQSIVYGGADKHEAILKYEKKVLDEHKHQKPHDETKPITVKEAMLNLEARDFAYDKPKKLFGFIPIGKRDGYLSGEERLERVEKEGGKITEKQRQEYLTSDMHIEIGIYSQIAADTIRRADKNKDGVITPKEFSDLVSEDAKRPKGKAFNPQELERLTNHLAKQIYGRE